MKYLVDTSALVRLLRLQAAEQYLDQADAGLIAICEPVITETMAIADAKSYRSVEEELRTLYPWVPVPDDAWDTVRRVRQALADHSAHQGLSVADHLVIATALRHRLTILYHDKDFVTVSRYVPEVKQEFLAG